MNNDFAPDWTAAPDWANWYAINGNGIAFWWENKPEPTGAWYWTVDVGRATRHDVVGTPHDWTVSLWERPEVQP